MDMYGTSCRSCSCTLVLLLPLLTITTTSTTSVVALVLQFLSWFSVLCLPLILVEAQYTNNPSINWTLSEYYYSNSSDFSVTNLYRYSDFTVCNNESSSFLLLNEQDNGLYGKAASKYSAHNSMRYSVYFGIYFVTAAENICLKDKDDHRAYYLSLVAQNAKLQDSNKGHVVWTANPEKPVTKNACLLLNGGDLTLLDYNDSSGTSPEVVWKISTGARNVSLAISYEGNIVLFSNTTNPPYVPLWESFQAPTDALMVLQVLENSSTLTVNSSVNSSSESSGNYTLAIRNGKLVLYARIGPLLDETEDSSYGIPYWVWPSSGVSANITFAAFCWDSVNQLRLYAGTNRPLDRTTAYRGMVSPEFCSTLPSNDSDRSREIPITGLELSMNATYATFLRLEADGDIHAYTVDNTSSYLTNNAMWREFYSVFNKTPCNLPLYCGFYGMCDPQKGDGSYCKCNYSDYPKLASLDTSNNRTGCNIDPAYINLRYEIMLLLWDIQNISLEASSRHNVTYNSTKCPTIDSIMYCEPDYFNCTVQFLSVDNVHYFPLNFRESYQRGNVSNDTGCKSECGNDSCCAAAFWSEETHKCFLVRGRLGTIQQRGTMKVFIKYVNITDPYVNFGSRYRFSLEVIGGVLAATILVAFIFLAYRRRRKRAHKLRELSKDRLLLLSHLDCSNTERFTWKQMHEYTCGFSDLLGGGGFGRVFRGALPDGTAIAVKQLDDEGPQGQGDKEFIAEVSILSRIHHAHLVHLIGFCLEGNHKLLVYEYMENGSLDTWLFKSHSPVMPMVQDAHVEVEHHCSMIENARGRESLPWKTRFQIALGTAKGLAYLHEECEEKVIHMDLKPQNILLGRNFQAKISDFGMSRRTAREQTSVMTVMRGTPGYLAPEWLLDCAITEKCDVYSLGIVLLEIVRGRKVKDVRELKQKLSMRPLRESVMLDLPDDRYRNNVNEKEAVRMVEVALLCVRTDPTKRPAMNSVVSMLEGKEEMLQELEEASDDYMHVEEEEQQLVAYPSPMIRTMRMEQKQQLGKFDAFSLTSLTDSASGSSSSSFRKYLNMDHNQLKAKAASLFERNPSFSTEWDSLLQNKHNLNAN